jgi:hypothetical protein
MQPIFLRATGDQTGRFPGGKLPESTGPGINPAKRYKFYPLPDIIRRIFKTYPGELQNFQNLEAFARGWDQCRKKSTEEQSGKTAIRKRIFRIRGCFFAGFVLFCKGFKAKK